jgi:hypothetical protein
MKAVRLLAVLLVVCLFAASCGEPPSAPVAPAASPAALPAPEASLIGDLLRPTGLLKCSDLPYDAETRTIGPAGGSISAGPHVLVIPSGALDGPTQITMTTTTGRGVNQVHFEPEGLQFDRSASLTMSYANCSLLGKLLPKRIAYTDERLNIISYLLSLDNIFAKRVTGRLDHFSDYAVAW